MKHVHTVIIYIEMERNMDKRYTLITLSNLANRITMNNKLMKEHPEFKNMLEANNKRQKEYIIKCILQNAENPLLEQIFFINEE